MSAAVAVYVMNPAEDEIRFGDEITDGMWVLPEDGILRSSALATEDQQLRDQRFRKVTRLRRRGDLIVFVGEWVDGYQRVHTYNASWAWLVKRDTPPEGEAAS